MTSKSEDSTNLPSNSVLRPPIFIHSLWRSGSTYIFSVFRRSKSGFWCYQEPIHEVALAARDNPALLLTFVSENLSFLRHPVLERPYFYELNEVHAYWCDVIKKPILYDQYFDGVGSDAIIQYLTSLILNAKGHPVIQECRTSCRIGAIKKSLGGSHIYLWRNPWDHWWSYKSTSFFDVTSLLILNSTEHPEVIVRLRKELDFVEFHNDDVMLEISHFDQKRLSSQQSYLVFYCLWSLGLLEGMKNADQLLNIDSMSTNQQYRDEVTSNIRGSNYLDIDFSDCNVSQTYYGESDRAFFSVVEERAHAILLTSGYSQTQLDQLSAMRKLHAPAIQKKVLSGISSEKILSDAIRAREIVVRQETENSTRLSHVFQTQMLEVSRLKSETAERLLVISKNAEEEKNDLIKLYRDRESVFKDQIKFFEEESQRNVDELKRKEQILSEQISSERLKFSQFKNECELRQIEYEKQLEKSMLRQQNLEQMQIDQEQKFTEQTNYLKKLAIEEKAQLQKLHSIENAQNLIQREKIQSAFNEMKKELEQQLLFQYPPVSD